MHQRTFRIKMTGDWHAGDPGQTKRGQMAEFKTKIIDIIQRTPTVKSFRLATKNIPYKAGQYLLVTANARGEEITKPLSLSSSPTENDHIEFTKRITDSVFSRKLDSMEAGEELEIKMPYGSFTLEENVKKLVLLSGGIGITPFRSICKYVTDTKADIDVVLVYGNSEEHDIIFKDELDLMRETNSRLHVVYTLTCADAKEKGWQGCCGYIDTSMIKREISDYSTCMYHVCGPPTMVECLIKELTDGLKIPEERIKIEKFAGYK